MWGYRNDNSVSPEVRAGAVPKVAVGENDSYRVAQIARMAEALKKTGVEHHHAVTPGMGHMVTDNVKTLGEIHDFFDKHLKGHIAKSKEEK